MTRPARGGGAAARAAPLLLLCLGSLLVLAPAAAARALAQAQDNGGGSGGSASDAATAATDPFAVAEPLLTEGQNASQPAADNTNKFGLAPGIGAPGGERGPQPPDWGGRAVCFAPTRSPVDFLHPRTC